MAAISINGKLHDKHDAKISVYDHGLLYGDGVFEGIRVYHGKVFRHRQHIERLYDSAKSIALTVPMPLDAMIAEVEKTVKASGLENGYIRLIVTRGVGTLGLVDDDTVDPTNLQRQILYAEGDAGAPKLAAAVRRLHALNSGVALEPHPVRLGPGNVEALFRAYDVVVDGTDNFPTRYLASVNNYFELKNLPDQVVMCILYIMLCSSGFC